MAFMAALTKLKALKSFPCLMQLTNDKLLIEIAVGKKRAPDYLT